MNGRTILGAALLGSVVALIGAAAVIEVFERTDPVARPAARPEEPEPPAPAPPPPPEDTAAATRAAYAAQYAGAKPAERQDAVRACLLSSTCSQAQLDGIVAAGAHEREREELRRFGHAWGAHAAAKRATDGQQRSDVAVAAVAAQLERCGLAELKKLDWTTQGEADKDIDAARGKMINVYGAVHQIRRDGDLHWGTMTTSAGWVYFVVVGGTKGVVAGRYAEIAGMVVQRYLYENALGGLTDSVLIVGRVRGQSDDDQPLPPAPPRSAAKVAAPAPAVCAPARPSAPPPSRPATAAAETAAPGPVGRRWSGVLDEAPPPPPVADKADAVAPPGAPASAE